MPLLTRKIVELEPKLARIAQKDKFQDNDDQMDDDMDNFVEEEAEMVSVFQLLPRLVMLAQRMTFLRLVLPTGARCSQAVSSKHGEMIFSLRNNVTAI